MSLRIHSRRLTQEPKDEAMEIKCEWFCLIRCSSTSIRQPSFPVNHIDYRGDTLPSAYNPSNRNVNASRIRSPVRQKVHIGTAQLPRLRKPRHAPIVLHFPVPLLRVLLNIIRGHLRPHETRGDAVDSDPVLRPLHRECVRQVPHRGFRRAVGG